MPMPQPSFSSQQIPAPSVGLADIDVVALTLYHEAANEGPRGMAAVASVITNRVAWGRWGDARGVCLAYKQFSCWRSGGGTINFSRLCDHANQIRGGERPGRMQRAYVFAQGVVGKSLLEDPTMGADHYYAPISMNPPSAAPYWVGNRKPTAIIGRHIFYRMRPDGATPT